jgi:hypothetical protein
MDLAGSNCVSSASSAHRQRPCAVASGKSRETDCAVQEDESGPHAVDVTGKWRDLCADSGVNAGVPIHALDDIVSLMYAWQC